MTPANEKYYTIDHEPVQARQRYGYDEVVAIQNKVANDRELAIELGRTIKAIEAKRQNIKKSGEYREFGSIPKMNMRAGFISEEEFNAMCEND